MRPRVHTEKHMVQFSLGTVASGALTGNVLVNTPQTTTPSTPSEVREGSTISAVYVEMWLTSDDGGQGTAIVTLEKRDGGVPIMTAANSASLDSYNNKKNVLHTFMGLIGGNTQYPTAAFRGWLKIPRSKQRFGILDSLILNIHGQSNGVSFCGFATYKEQY